MKVAYFEIKKQTLAKIVAFVISIILVAILLSQVERGDVVSTLAGIDPIYVIIGFILYVCSYFFRALRFHILLNKEVGLRDLFNIVCVHNMVNNILPARTGELSYIYFLKDKASVGRGIATLSIARAFDFIAISTLFFIAAISVGELPPVISTAFLIIAIFLVIIVLFMIISVYKGKEFMNKIAKIAKKLTLKKFRVAEFLIEKGNETASSFYVIQSKKVVSSTFLSSALIWLSIYCMYFVLLSGMNIDLSITLVVLGSTFSIFTNILPIPSIGTFGVYEGAWAIALIPLGISKETAISIGFSVHIILFVYFLVLGCYGLLTLKFKGINAFLR